MWKQPLTLWEHEHLRMCSKPAIREHACFKRWEKIKKRNLLLLGHVVIIEAYLKLYWVERQELRHAWGECGKIELCKTVKEKRVYWTCIDNISRRKDRGEKLSRKAFIGIYHSVNEEYVMCHLGIKIIDLLIFKSGIKK